MINITTIAGLDGPRNWGFPPDYISEDKMITDRQRKTLVELINSRIEDETIREHHFSQIDSMTSDDAEDVIFGFLTNQWG